jgi:Anti-sigma factor NepR
VKNPTRNSAGLVDGALDELHAELDPKVQAALGQALQAHFDDLASAPVPDRFLVLLAELEAKERREER